MAHDLRTIVPAATSITGFIGRARRDPVNRPVHVGSAAEYVRAFGALVRDDTLGLAVQQYFANGGHEAVVVRVRSHTAISDPALESRREGIWALDDVDLHDGSRSTSRGAFSVACAGRQTSRTASRSGRRCVNATLRAMRTSCAAIGAP